MKLPDNAEELVLLVSDGGDGISHDWAAWIEPRVELADGSITKLTDLDWKSARSGFGQVRKNANCRGGPISVHGQAYADGIGVHAPSVVVYALPDEAVRFRARGALDDGGTVRTGALRTPTSVRFAIWAGEAGRSDAASTAYVKKTSAPGREASEAIDSLDVHPELGVQLFASEPMITSPSSIDIDERGRVWVCDVVNYRRNQGKRPEGDRILVLEDTDGDAKADRSTVFHQGEDVNSAHGICVIGDRVVISAGDEIFSLYDRDGDGRADPGSKEVLFTDIGGRQHDHGIHAVHFGPDGRLYFNFGNAGKRLRRPDGEVVTDIHGVRCTSENNRPYQQGMIFRCEPDGSKVELLAWNFRNNWEACVDSYGGIWQSDNDDDGNRGVRINFVLEFGNYGYRDERTGAGWRTPRPGMSAEIPERHWHLADPGVVPNLLQTGAGSPTGICVYEGDLLPGSFRGQLIHCDAGPNVVRAYPTTRDGAGYTAKTVDVLKSTRDRWFRPSDVSVAPDGSLFVADWYDPGVGGHGMGDIEKGRIFRVIPSGDSASSYRAPGFDDALDRLASPNAAARANGWSELAAAGESVEAGLIELHSPDSGTAAPIRARALWLLARLPGGLEHLERALSDPHPDLRLTAVRAARQIRTCGAIDDATLLSFLRKAAETDVHSPMAREIFVALRTLGGEDADRLWSDLARDNDPGDRWLLEAAGIGATDRWDERTARFFEHMMPYDRYTRYLWRARSEDAPERIAKELLRDPAKKMPDEPSPLDYLRALELQPHEAEKTAAYRRLFLEATSEVALFAAARLGAKEIDALDGGPARLDELLSPIRGTEELVELSEKLHLTGMEEELAASIANHPDGDAAVTAARLLLGNRGKLLQILRAPGEVARASAIVAALGKTGDQAVGSLLAGELVRQGTPAPLRVELVNALAMNGRSGRELLRLAQAGDLAGDLKPVAALAIARSPDAGLRNAAREILPPPQAVGAENFPPLADLVGREGDPSRGPELYSRATCATCHRIDGGRVAFGPDLGEIGNKLSREGLFEAILFPSAAISHGFHGVEIEKEDGSALVGYLTGETDEALQLRLPGGVDQEVAKDEIAKREEIDASLMPPGLAGVIGPDGLVDLVAWLETRR